MTRSGAQRVGHHHPHELLGGGLGHRAPLRLVGDARVDEQQVVRRRGASRSCRAATCSSLGDVEVLDRDRPSARWSARSCSGVTAVVSRTVPMTFQPRFASSSTIARPRPREAPTIRAVLTRSVTPSTVIRVRLPVAPRPYGPRRRSRVQDQLGRLLAALRTRVRAPVGCGRGRRRGDRQRPGVEAQPRSGTAARLFPSETMLCCAMTTG